MATIMVIRDVPSEKTVNFCNETPTDHPAISFHLGQKAIVISDQSHPDGTVTVEVLELGSFLVDGDTRVVIVEEIRQTA